MKTIFSLFVICLISIVVQCQWQIDILRPDPEPINFHHFEWDWLSDQDDEPPRSGAPGTSNPIAQTRDRLANELGNLYKLREDTLNEIKVGATQGIDKTKTQGLVAQLSKLIEENEAALKELINDSKKESRQIESNNQIRSKALSSGPVLNAATNGVDTFQDFVGNITSETQRIAHVCFRNILDNIPPSFCWKKNGDVGEIPTHCPAGYFRHLALCFKDCEDGYEFGGLLACRKKCDVGYSTKGLLCTKSLFDWYFRKFYLPHSLTNFNEAVECPAGKYKALALCYKDCRKISLTNCGWGACSLSKAQCISSILHFSVDFLLGLGKLLTFIGQQIDNPNLQNIAKDVQNAISKVGSDFVKKAFESLKTWISDSSIKAFFVNTVANYTRNWIQDKFNKFLELPDVVQICGNVHTELTNQIVASNDPKVVAGLEGLVSQATEVIAECANLDFKNGSTEDEAHCIKKVLTTASIYDPTGLATMFAAFAHPVCDVDK